MWRRELEKTHVEVTTTWFSAPVKSRQRRLEQSLEDYGRFLGLSVRVA